MRKLIAVLLFSVVVVAVEEFRGDQVLRIRPTNEENVEHLKKIIDTFEGKIDIWKYIAKPHEDSDIHVTAKDIPAFVAFLSHYNITYKIMVADLEENVQEEMWSNKKNAFSFGFQYDKYNGYSEIQAELRALAASSRGKASVFSVGSSYEGRDLTGIKISSGGFNKPIIWVDGGIHAREWISPATVMYLIRELVRGVKSTATEALRKYDFHILPVFNPDGYEYTRSGGRRARLWRKTRRSYGWCKGADPNRNWDANFGGRGASDVPCHDTYHGPSAFSEPETKAGSNYLKTIQDRLKAFWSVHAYSQLVLTPYGYTRSHPTDYDEQQRVGNVFAEEVRKRYGTGYRVGPIATIIYEASGGSIDWVYDTLGVRYSYGLELRDTGSYGFLLPASQIIPTGEETTDALLAAVNSMR